MPDFLPLNQQGDTHRLKRCGSGCVPKPPEAPGTPGHTLLLTIIML